MQVWHTPPDGPNRTSALVPLNLAPEAPVPPSVLVTGRHKRLGRLGLLSRQPSHGGPGLLLTTCEVGEVGGAVMQAPEADVVAVAPGGGVVHPGNPRWRWRWARTSCCLRMMVRTVRFPRGYGLICEPASNRRLLGAGAAGALGILTLTIAVLRGLARPVSRPPEVRLPGAEPPCERAEVPTWCGGSVVCWSRSGGGGLLLGCSVGSGLCSRLRPELHCTSDRTCAVNGSEKGAIGGA